MADHQTHWHLRLFSKSVSKQAKWGAICTMLGDCSGQRCLDLGSDNGVISFLLRQQSGTWYSADLAAHAVDSIRSLVSDHVYQIDGRTLPFPDGHFDAVVVIDMLEHVTDDNAFVREIHRVLSPEGKLIANVPHAKKMSLLRPLRLALGLTDEWHGHVRPGYSLADLKRLLAEGFDIQAHRTYNRFFSELLDIALNYAYVRKSTTTETETSKGTVVTQTDIARHEKAFRLYSWLYPFMRLFAGLDILAQPFSGYSLIASARKSSSPSSR